jgi:putative phosphoribosyl transferase
MMPEVRGRTVILVDDGLASGATLRAAARVVRRGKPARLIAAVPVASAAHCDDVRATVDELIAVATPDPFETVSAWYEDFSPVTDADVLRLLGRDAPAIAGTEEPDEHDVAIPTADGDDSMHATVGVPDSSPAGLVVFAHGGGSSRNSYRNRYLAGRLRDAGWATLRVDLLVEREQGEDVDGAVRFDISRIAARLIDAMDWAGREAIPGAHRIVLFGASTGAAAAMVAAASRPSHVIGVASRGGLIDLAGAALAALRSPVLMVVGGADVDTLRLTRDAAKRLRCPKRLTIVRGAGHIFDEPGAIGLVGEHVARWLDRLDERRPSRWRWLRSG